VNFTPGGWAGLPTPWHGRPWALQPKRSPGASADGRRPARAPRRAGPCSLRPPPPSLAGTASPPPFAPARPSLPTAFTPVLRCGLPLPTGLDRCRGVRHPHAPARRARRRRPRARRPRAPARARAGRGPLTARARARAPRGRGGRAPAAAARRRHTRLAALRVASRRQHESPLTLVRPSNQQTARPPRFAAAPPFSLRPIPSPPAETRRRMGGGAAPGAPLVRAAHPETNDPPPPPAPTQAPGREAPDPTGGRAPAACIHGQGAAPGAARDGGAGGHAPGGESARRDSRGAGRGV
jgi:hypothetical protein